MSCAHHPSLGLPMFGENCQIFLPVHCLITIISVPVTSLPDLVSETKKDIDNSGIVSAIIGHVGDGSLAVVV